MNCVRSTLRILAGCAFAWTELVTSMPLGAQGLTTGAIRGIVRTSDPTDAEGTRVTIRNESTGFAVESTVRFGRFFIDGLAIGGPYTVRVRRLGYQPVERRVISLGLGEPVELEFSLGPIAASLDTVHATALASAVLSATRGIGTTVRDSVLRRLPSLNRSFYDFVRFAPQASTKIGFSSGGIAGGGAGFRANSFLVNGVPQRSVGGHVPPEFGGTESVPFDAVREYRIHVAPFDVRYADFTGLLVNAITFAGTNELHGSAFMYGRSDALAFTSRESASAYDRFQYGLSLGGPVRRDRMHFFVATDLQRLSAPAAGPYVGQPPSDAEAVPVTSAEVARLSEIMQQYGLVAGTGGRVQNTNPLGSVFGRVDLALPEWRSRVVAWINDSRGRSSVFSRAARDTFLLSSFSSSQKATRRSAALEIHTTLRRDGGGHNELLIATGSGATSTSSDVRQPVILVAVPATTGGIVTLVTGTPQVAQGSALSGDAVSLHDVLTLPLGASHVATLGIDAESFDVKRHGVFNAYGTWTFDSLDSLARGVADRFEISKDFSGASGMMRGRRLALFAGDEWRASDRLSFSAGIRSDAVGTGALAPYNRAVDSIFGRRTDQPILRPRVQLSPRLGFEWDVSGTGRDRVHGGIGVFTDRPPAAWLQAPLYSNGIGIGNLTCGIRPADLGMAPPFASDYRRQPAACASGGTVNSPPMGDVELVDPDLRLAQTARAAVGYDRRLRPRLVASLEAMGSKSMSDFIFVNSNLAGPVGVDRNGRILYGNIPSTGRASPALRSSFPEVVELRNTSGNSAYQLSAKLEQTFQRGSALTAYYTFSRVRDVQTPLRVNNRALVNWASRAVSGRHEDLSPGISLNDVPHRVVIAGTHRFSWVRASPSELAFYYVGESGSPFTYIATGGAGRGDLNADGSNANDPIYVPRNALDTTEIRFAPLTRPTSSGAGPAELVTAERQAAEFERLIDATSCLRRQRGHFVGRNTCREPWTNTTVASLRQLVPVGRGVLEAEVDAYNFLYLIRRDWGLYRVAVPSVLNHVGQVVGANDTTQPIFTFTATAPRWTTLPTESSFQMQFALRYRF